MTKKKPSDKSNYIKVLEEVMEEKISGRNTDFQAHAKKLLKTIEDAAKKSSELDAYLKEEQKQQALLNTTTKILSFDEERRIISDSLTKLFEIYESNKNLLENKVELFEISSNLNKVIENLTFADFYFQEHTALTAALANKDKKGKKK